MRRELSTTSRRLRSVAFFVTAGLLLSGCVRVTYNATLNANSTMSGTVEELLPDSVVRLFDDMSVFPRTAPIADFSYSDWSTDSVAHTCTLANPEVRVANSRFDSYQPQNTVFLYGLTMHNASSATYQTTISAVVTEVEDTVLILNDIVVQSECPNPGDWVEGGKIATGANTSDFFGDPATNDDLLVAMSHIPATDKAYFYSLFLLEIEGIPYLDISTTSDEANRIITEVIDDAVDHPLAVGEFPSRINEIEGMKAVRHNGAKGLSFTFTNLPLASAASYAPNVVGDGPNFEKSGNEWKLTMVYPTSNGMQDFQMNTASPSSTSSARVAERAMDAYAELAADHTFTVNGVITETNGAYNATNNSVYFGFYVNSVYQTVTDTAAPILTSVLGTAVKFTYKKRTLSKDGKAAVKRAKAGLLKAKQITIVGILDGTKTTAGEKRRVKLLAQARAKALGKYLANLGVTAKITYSYSTLKKSNIDAVIKAGQRRAVIQVIN